MDSLEKAYAECVELAYSHYENFPVARLVSKKLRPHVAAVYAFARTADDIADENYGGPAPDDGASRIALLAEFESQLDVKSPGELNPKWKWIFTALKDTIGKFSIPDGLFRDLISAFAQDVVKKRYATFGELLDYCRRSANPVGRLVLILHGMRDESLFRLSDKICTALQLANFWQDMGVDKLKDRIYIPREDFGGIPQERVFSDAADGDIRKIVKFEVERTEKMLLEGAPLVKRLAFPLSLEIKITVLGGLAVLKKIRRQNFDTLSRRPSLGRRDKIGLFISALFP